MAMNSELKDALDLIDSAIYKGEFDNELVRAEFWEYIESWTEALNELDESDEFDDDDDDDTY